MSEEKKPVFKPVAPMPKHKDVRGEQAPSAPVQHMAAPMPTPMSGVAASATPTQTSSLAVLALILGILSIFISIIALPALIAAIVALKQTSNNRQGGHGLAVAGLVTSIIGMLLSIFWILIIASSLLIARSATHSTSTAGPSAIYQDTAGAKATKYGIIKQPVVADKYVLTVNSVTQGYAPTSGHQPAPGYQYVLVSVTINNNDSYTHYCSEADFKLRDSSGVEHTSSYLSDTPDAFPYEGVKSGGMVTGNLVFEVPLTSTSPTLIFDSYLNAQKTEVTL